MDAGRYGHRDRCRAAAYAQGGGVERPRPAVSANRVPSQAACVRGGRARLVESDSDSRRLRLPEGFTRRAFLPRRQIVRDWRRHVGGAAHGDCQRCVEVTKQRVIVANCGGFWGDDPTAARRQVEGGPIDYLVMDYLAEVTMAILQKQRARNPDGG